MATKIPRQLKSVHIHIGFSWFEYMYVENLLDQQWFHLDVRGNLNKI